MGKKRAECVNVLIYVILPNNFLKSKHLTKFGIDLIIEQDI
jgi:hypothetical protein